MRINYINYKYNIWIDLSIAFVFLSLLYLAYARYMFDLYDNMLVVFGGSIIVMLLFYILNKGVVKYSWYSTEVMLFILFNFYMLIVGVFVYKDMSYQHALWVSVTKYQVLFVSVYFLTIIKKNSEFLSYIIIVVNLFVVITFVNNPIEYRFGRLSLSQDLNPNNLGMGLSFATWTVLYLIGRKKVKLLFGIALISLFLYGIFLTGSRKSLLAVILMVLLWLILCYNNIEKKKTLYKNMYLVMILLGAISLLSPYYYDSTISERMRSFGDEIGSGIGRWALYESGYKYFLESPIFGYGYGGFKLLYGRFYSHSTIVEIFVSGGLIGGIIYFSVYIMLFLKLFRLSFLSNTEKYNQTIVDIRAVFILFLGMLFYATVIIHPYDLHSMVILGLITGMVNYSSDRNNLIKC